jgi:RNA polymerase sigma-70 factor (ECF subfamily)
VSNDIAAEDITIRVFFKAWEQIDRYQAFGSSFIAWLYSIARIQVISYYYSYKKNIVQDDRFVMPAGSRYQVEEVQGMFDMQVMRDSLQFLTEEEQQILILKFIVGLPIKNIARIMARHESDVLILQTRALQTLARYLQDKALI